MRPVPLYAVPNSAWLLAGPGILSSGTSRRTAGMAGAARAAGQSRAGSDGGIARSGWETYGSTGARFWATTKGCGRDGRVMCRRPRGQQFASHPVPGRGGGGHDSTAKGRSRATGRTRPLRERMDTAASTPASSSWGTLSGVGRS